MGTCPSDLEGGKCIGGRCSAGKSLAGKCLAGGGGGGWISAWFACMEISSNLKRYWRDGIVQFDAPMALGV